MFERYLFNVQTRSGVKPALPLGVKMGRPKEKIAPTADAVMDVYTKLRTKEHHGYVPVSLPALEQYITRCDPASMMEDGRVSDDFGDRLAQTAACLNELARIGLIEKVSLVSALHEDGTSKRTHGMVIRIVRPELSDDEVTKIIQENLEVDFYQVVVRLRAELADKDQLIAELRQRLDEPPAS